MTIGLLGYGAMGTSVESVALSRGHTVAARIEGPGQELAAVDVWIDFSCSDALVEYLPRIAAAGVPVVIGSTGWDEQKDEYDALLKKAKVPAVWGSNFSPSVLAFFAVGKCLASYAESLQLDAAITETHHTRKKDAPSGTALRLAEEVLQAMPSKKGIVKNGAHQKDALSVSALRVGQVVGEHSLVVDGTHETIALTHQSKGRGSYALGAVLAAEKVHTLPAGLTDVRTVTHLLFNFSL